MKVRAAIAVFVLLSVCSVASVKVALETDPAFDGGGGIPTPCIPTTTCSVSK